MVGKKMNEITFGQRCKKAWKNMQDAEDKERKNKEGMKHGKL